MLDNIPHVKAFWIMLGLKVAQLSTAFGVDDLDGTVVEERITHMAGATTPEALSKDDLVGMIAETGHVPVERDTLYRVVKRTPRRPTPRLGRRADRRAAAVGVFPRRRVAACAPRLGHIQFLNCLPLYYGLVKNDVLLDVDLVKADPARPRARCSSPASSTSRRSPRSSTRATPTTSCCSPTSRSPRDGEVQSILLLSKRPAEELGGAHRRADRQLAHVAGARAHPAREALGRRRRLRRDAARPARDAARGRRRAAHRRRRAARVPPAD